jgi:hypothetical protein
MSHTHRFHRELDRVRLRAMLAVERASADPDDEVVARLGHQLVTLEDELLDLHDDDRTQLLAWRLGLEDVDVELLWTVVAASIDPLLVSHLVVLGGKDALRGATLRVHAAIWELSGEQARALALRLAGAHPLIRDHVLAWTSDATLPTRTLAAAPRTIAWLAGDDTLDAALVGAGSVFDTPHDVALDTGLYESLLTTPAPLLMVEGTIAPGVLLAAARKAGREVIALDLRCLPHDELEAALIALRRECRLREALPLVLHLEELQADPRALRAVTSAIATMPGPFAAMAHQRGPALAVPRPTIHVSVDPITRS